MGKKKFKSPELPVLARRITLLGQAHHTDEQRCYSEPRGNSDAQRCHRPREPQRYDEAREPRSHQISPP
jgi:hypothetical protein